MWLVHIKIQKETEAKKKMAGKKYKMSGMLRGVEMTEGPKQDGDTWHRASLKIEKSDGVTRQVSTFDTNDAKIANEANGKEIEVQYTKSKDDKYNNLEKGSIKVTGQGEAPVIEQEAVEEDAVEEKGKEIPVKNIEKNKPVNKPLPKMYSDDYWREKFEFEKKTHYERQTSIVRQNSWSQAMKYLESCLKAVEQGLIPKKDFTSKEMSTDQLKEIAHQIETDILRKENGDRKKSS